MKMNFESETLDEFMGACAEGRGLYEGLAIMGGRGKLGAVAKEIERLAEAVTKTGYVPPEREKEYAYHDRLAKSVGDREVARFHRAKAAEIKNQLGEGRK